MKKANRLGKRRETRQKDESWFQVRSQTSSFDLWHDIILTEYGLRCDCSEYSNSNLKCKHIFAIENAYPNTRSTTVDIIPKQKVEINKIIDPIPASRCRKCGTTDIKRDGVRKNNNQIVQKYKCNICNAFFQITLDSKTCMHGRNAVICSSFVRLTECSLCDQIRPKCNFWQKFYHYLSTSLEPVSLHRPYMCENLHISSPETLHVS